MLMPVFLAKGEVEAFSPRTSTLEALLGLAEQSIGIGADGSAYLNELGHVQATLARLVLRDKGLTLIEDFRQLLLRDAGCFASLHKLLDDKPIIICVNRNHGIASLSPAIYKYPV